MLVSTLRPSNGAVETLFGRENMLTKQLEKPQIAQVSRSDVQFVSVMLVLFALAGLVAGTPQIAMWFGFALAGYSAIANDSLSDAGYISRFKLKAHLGLAVAFHGRYLHRHDNVQLVHLWR